MADQRPVEHEESQDGYEKVLADYEKELARYLQARIKPGLSRSAIPRWRGPSPRRSPRSTRLSRSAAVTFRRPEVARLRTSRQTCTSSRPRLGDEWILRFSVHGEDGWLTAEKQDLSQRVEAATAEQLVRIVEAMHPRE
jgi:hypothetical protein